MTKDEIMKYWVYLSDVDFRAMQDLFASGHYTWTLFVGHLVLEKLLKAYYVKYAGTNTPLTHHLLQIAEKTDLQFSEEQKDFLLEVTAFNLQARYPDYKLRFYKKATKEFTENYLLRIKEFRQWLLEKISS